MLYKQTTSKGFTLIELLVVISIITLLSSIIFASLNGARVKARDAAIKSQLSSLRNAAELIYSTTGTYDTVCSPSINSGAIFASAFNQGNKVDNQSVCVQSNASGYYAWNGSLAILGKPTTPDKWGASIRLPGSGNYFCVNYQGIAREQPTIGVYFEAGGTSDADC